MEYATQMAKSAARPMRRAAKEVTDWNKIKEFLNISHVGYLGLVDEEGTYVVPLNYAWHNGSIYFHGGNEGRKVSALQMANTICFTVSEEFGIIADPVPANTGTSYMSVMVFGKAEKVVDIEEATEALQIMLDKYVPGYFSSDLSKGHVEKYRSGMGSPVSVYKIQPERISAKEDKDEEGMMFYGGRRQADDLKRARGVQ